MMLSSQVPQQKIAIIGSGISGLGIAYLLAPVHNLTVYEKNDYLGGHSRTVDVPTEQGSVAVDTGFIVFNDRNYPLLKSLFSHLEVPVQKSNMSFGVSIADGWLEYGTRGLPNIFVQKSNLLNLRFLGMIKDILKFNRLARDFLECDPSVTLGQCLDELKMGEWFRQYYLLAMGGSIWSTPVSAMLDFPARTFLRFFDNHGLLTVNDHPQWYTVSGGSREYVKRLTTNFSGSIMTSCAVIRVSRDKDCVRILDSQGKTREYDAVIFASHPDQALRLIENPTTTETAVLSAFRYQPNRVLLHCDVDFMPKRKGAWASWVYLSNQAEKDNTKVSLSYWMNNLQSLNTNTPILVTLNPGWEPKKELVFDEYWFDHPIFDEAAISAQQRIDEIQGFDRFWFCGAYQRYGFHEDGLYSALNTAQKMGVRPLWI